MTYAAKPRRLQQKGMKSTIPACQTVPSFKGWSWMSCNIFGEQDRLDIVVRLLTSIGTAFLPLTHEEPALESVEVKDEATGVALLFPSACVQVSEVGLGLVLVRESGEGTPS
jgi:hypothetical protein